MNSREALLKELKNSDPQIRIKAIQALGEIGYKLPNFPIESLIQIFHEDEDELVRQTARSIIIKINEPIVTHLLQNLYHQWDNEIYVQQTIVDSLEKLGQASVFTLISILNNPQSPLRSEAAHALCLLKDPQGIKAIITVALKSKDEAIRHQAIQVLESYGYWKY